MIEQELHEYINISDNLNQNDKFKYLKAIFDKHFSLENMSNLLTYYDFQLIVSNAKSNFVKMPTPMSISNQEVYPTEVSHVAMIEAILLYLHKHDVLKRRVDIDFTTKIGKQK